MGTPTTPYVAYMSKPRIKQRRGKEPKITFTVSPESDPHRGPEAWWAKGIIFDPADGREYEFFAWEDYYILVPDMLHRLSAEADYALRCRLYGEEKARTGWGKPGSRRHRSERIGP